MKKDNKNKSIKKRVLAGIAIFLCILIVTPLVKAQINYSSNKLLAQSFTGYNLEGYINNQSLTKDFKYGFNTSNKGGCGWIASYNVLTYLYNKGLYDKKPNVEEVILTFDRFGSLGFGFLGTNPLVIKWFLQNRGLKVSWSTKTSTFEERAKEADINIILYFGYLHSSSHYQMVKYEEDTNDFRFFTPASTRSMQNYIDTNNEGSLILFSIKAS